MEGHSVKKSGGERREKAERIIFQKRSLVCTNKPKGIKLMPWSPTGFISRDMYL